MAPQVLHVSSNMGGPQEWTGGPYVAWGQPNSHSLPEQGYSPGQCCSALLSHTEQGMAAVWPESSQGSGSWAWQLPAR